MNSSSGTRDTRRYLAFFAALSGIKFVLTMPLRIFATHSPHDDFRLVQMSFDLLAPHAPPYDHMMLIRSLGYPVYLAVLYTLHLPIYIAQEALYQSAGLFLGLTCLRILRARVGAFLFLPLYIWAPYSFLANRQINAEILSTALVIFLLACWIILLHHSAIRRRTLGLEVLAAGVMGYFWQVRPDSIWIVPAFVLWLGMDRGILTRFRRGVLPLIAILIGSFSAKTWNAHRNGVYATSDLTQKQFQRAYGALSRIQSVDRFRDVPVSRQVRSVLYQVSPAFKELKPYFDGTGRAWINMSCGPLKICDDYAVGWFFWAFRDAAAQAGYYATPAKAEDFYGRIADEVTRACATGRLNCTPAYFTPSKGDVDLLLLMDRWPKLFAATGTSIHNLDTSIAYCDLADGQQERYYRLPFEQLNHSTRRPHSTLISRRIHALERQMIGVMRNGYIIVISLLEIFLLIGLPILWLQRRDSLLKSTATLAFTLVATRVVMLAVMSIAGSNPKLIAERYIWPEVPFFLFLVSLSAEPVLRVIKRRMSPQKTALSTGIREEL